MTWIRCLLFIIHSSIPLSHSFIHFSVFRQLLVNSKYALNREFAINAKGSSEGNRKWSKIKKGDPNLIRAKSLAKGRDPIISLNMNLDYLAKSGQKGAARRAEELLLRIENLYNEGYYDSRPDIVSYNTVLNAYALNGAKDDYDSTAEILRLLYRMEELGEKDNSVKPNVITLNIVIRSLAKNGQTDSAEKLLHEMEECYHAGMAAKGPNTITFNEVIDAFAKAKNPEKAEEILKLMMRISRDERRKDDIKADTIAFNTVLHAWANSEHKGAAVRAQQLLDHMTKLYHSGNKDVKPDVFSYTATISAWAHNRHDPLSCEKAIDLLHKMEEKCALGDKDVCPNTVTYTTVINALGRSHKKGASLRALDILLEMEKQYSKGNEDLKPDALSYSSVIDAFSKCRESYAAEKAAEVLDRMITLSQTEGFGSISPNTQTYCSVITALGNSKVKGAADKAHRILNEMEHVYGLGNSNVCPNTIIYNAVIDAWAQSSFVYKAQRAHDLLIRMESEYEMGNIMYKPDIITYNSVIKAAANSFGEYKIKSQAFRIAISCFKTVQQSNALDPTSRTYSMLIKAIRKLTPPGENRDFMTGRILEHCCKDGLVNHHILSQLEITFSNKSVYLEKMNVLGYSGIKNVSIVEIPHDWKCNCDRK